jgi:hypothetical protein
MACGVPLVTTTGGALPEVVGTPGESAMTVPPGDPGALAQQIIEVLNNHELRARLGEGGRRRVLDRFTWRRTAEGSAEHYYLELEAHTKRMHDAASAGGSRSELAGARASSEPGIPASSESDKKFC